MLFLLVTLTRREVQQRFRRSWLGLGWLLLVPLLLLGVYTLVFQHVFALRWPGLADTTGGGVALRLFMGLMVFSWFADAVGRAPLLVVQQPQLVKRVVFPLPLLVCASVLASAVQFAVSMALAVVAAAWWGEGLGPAVLALPLAALLFAAMLAGLTFLLAALGVYLRDLQPMVAVALTPLMFLAPVFYPLEALPGWLQSAVLFNPMTLIIELMRALVLGHPMPRLEWLAGYLAVTVALLWGGLRLFQRLSRGFADEL